MQNTQQLVQAPELARASERQINHKVKDVLSSVYFVLFLTRIWSLFPFLRVQLIENSMCLLRNLSYQVHREIPGCERFQEALPLNQGPAPSGQKGGCFSSRKSKGRCQARSVSCACLSPSKARPRRSETGAHTCAVTCTKQNASLSEECQQFSPAAKWLIPCAAALCLSFTESIDLLLSNILPAANNVWPLPFNGTAHSELLNSIHLLRTPLLVVSLMVFDDA